MSDADNSSFTNFGKFVPGFDFLQNLATQAAGSASQKSPQLPNLGSWVAPTLNVEELDKRIQELKAVQFWLDQNATALKATIQALEVQKMTLATLKGMNFNMGEVANAFKLKVAESMAGTPSAAEKPRGFAGLEIPPTSFGMGKTPEAVEDEEDEGADEADEVEAPEPAPAKRSASRSKATPAAPAAGVVDPMQWWGALTQQFQTIAADAMKEAAKKTAIDPGKNVATGLAKEAMKTATEMADTVGKTMAGNARTAMNTALRSSQAWPSPASKKPASAKAPAKPKAAVRKPAKKAARKTARPAARKTSR